MGYLYTNRNANCCISSIMFLEEVRIEFHFLCEIIFSVYNYHAAYEPVWMTWQSISFCVDYCTFSQFSYYDWPPSQWSINQQPWRLSERRNRPITLITFLLHTIYKPPRLTTAQRTLRGVKNICVKSKSSFIEYFSIISPTQDILVNK
jgi:hypothetical protein